MTFKEIMALSLSPSCSTTVAHDICKELNRIRKEDPECTGFSDSLFFFRIPDRDITEDELFDHVCFDKMQYGTPGRFEEIKTYYGLLQSWYTIKPESH